MRHHPFTTRLPRWAALAVAAALSTAAAAAPPYDPTLLFDWAERQHPQLFPGPQADRVFPPYVYRHYPDTGYALGVAGDRIALMGPLTGGTIQDIGAMADYECRVLPARCSGVSLEQRRAAAAAAAAGDAACADARPFHWSIGDAGGTLAEGRVGDGAPQADTVMPIASASKWLWGAFVAEHRQGEVHADDVPLLNFTSGYSGFGMCLPQQTVAECQSYEGLLLKNGGFDAAHVGRFYYGGGHMQMHAVRLGLGADGNAALARRVGDALGIVLAYTQPQPAGGVSTSATQYGRFLQRLAAGRLRLSSQLASHAVCTDPATCASAVSSPIAGSLAWHYSLGHWIEDDPNGGDAALSSAGAFGFYPWLDAGKTWWGIVARHEKTGLSGDDSGQRPARQSAACGARIRAAWVRGGPG